MSKLILTFLILSAPVSFAEGFFLHPSIAIGHNDVQGTHTTFGLDAGTYYDQYFAFGAGAYFAAGEHPEHDREIGAGPFVKFSYPLLSFLTFRARQDLLYVDARIPQKSIVAGETVYSHTDESGAVSATSAGLQINPTPNFAISGGYRFVLALSNSDLDDDRSGFYVGVAIGL